MHIIKFLLTFYVNRNSITTDIIYNTIFLKWMDDFIFGIEMFYVHIYFNKDMLKNIMDAVPETNKDIFNFWEIRNNIYLLIMNKSI